MPRSAPFALVMLLVAAASPAQESPDQQARRLLEDGRGYLGQGKLKQAFDNFSIVVTSFPGTDSVGQALLEIGRYRLEVDGDFDKARAAFEQVTKEHARSDAAPGAYYNLGLLTLTRATSLPEVEDAIAQFTRVETLYPRSSWVPSALLGAATAQRRAGRYAEAVDLDRRVALEYPASEAAAAAQFEIGQALALSGEPRQAMEEFQRVRNLFPASAWAEPALQRISGLYRLFGSAKPVFTVDASFALAGGDVLKDVKALAMTPRGVLWVASNKTKSAVLFEGGKPGVGLTSPDPRTLSIGPAGEVVFAGRGQVHIGLKGARSFATPPRQAGEPIEVLEDIQAAAVTAAGSILVSDQDRERVLRFDPSGKYLGTFPPNDAAKRRVTRIVVDSERGVVTLDREERTLRAWDENGRLLRTLTLPPTVKRPADVAVDAFRNLYLADEELGVLVFDQEGRLLTTITSPGLRARAVTVDASGAVLVYDARAERALRFR